MNLTQKKNKYIAQIATPIHLRAARVLSGIVLKAEFTVGKPGHGRGQQAVRSVALGNCLCFQTTVNQSCFP